MSFSLHRQSCQIVPHERIKESVPDINLDTYAGARASADESLSEVYHGDMPIDGYTVTEEQKQAFYVWASCGTPE